MEQRVRGRRMHFVGTLPQFATAAEAFTWQTGQLGDAVERLSGGETGARLAWFVPLVKELMRSPKIRARRTGDWTGYDDVDRLAVRRGQALTAEDIPLRWARWAEEELAVLEALGTPATRQRPLQVGLPAFLDLCLFIFGPTGPVRQGRAFLDAVTAQAEQVIALGGERVVLQLETPAAAIAVASAPPPLRWPVAAAVGGLILRQVRRAPRGSRIGLHLCLGDMGHKARVGLRSAAPLVTLANVLVGKWPEGRTLEYVHLPLCAGDQPPSTEPAFYSPLRHLGLPPGTPLVAGIAHENQSERTQREVRDMVERAVGTQVDIATACGLGRRGRSQAETAVGRMRGLLT
ncbi:hypothetical protein ACH4C2_36830 [Streptomyces sp. NPDC018057]|uniref:hypothetical protein n=1 Tax=unclassified Streptomyces TaxID=2593676 RepID=UPI0037B82708